MKEKKEYYPNGNIKLISYKDDNNVLQGICKNYFYNKKLERLCVLRDDFIINVCQYWFDYDENNLFYARKGMASYTSSIENGANILFHYEGDEERLTAKEATMVKPGSPNPINFNIID